MDDEFNIFWKAFPRKIAKGDARKAFAQTATIRPSIEVILSAIAEARKHWDSPSFIPYPATWLRAERWDDCWEVEITAQDASSASDAWASLRDCLRFNKAPPDAIKSAAQAIGGFHRLQEMSSFDIGKLQGQFEQAYKLGAH